jgi:hypothetical protein
MDVFYKSMVREGTIAEKDLGYVTLVDSPEEAVESIRSIAMNRFGLTYAREVKPKWFLGERAIRGLWNRWRNHERQ